jgi:y4mF family transcriptional regulator
MIAKIIGKILKHAQTMGKEDILTAILATMFEYSPGLIKAVFSKVDTDCHNYLNDTSKIQTGITYFSKGNKDEDYNFRPDLLISDKEFNFENNSPFILVESKIFAPITTNQYKGYPEIKSKYKDSAVFLITNYEKEEQEEYFDFITSWSKVFNSTSSYIKGLKNDSEKLLLNELLSIFHELGIEFNEYLFLDIESLKPTENGTDLSKFVKAMRKNSGLTQEQFAKEVGVGLRFLRDLEQGNKSTLRMDKVNDVLIQFNCELGPIGKTSANNI